MKYTLNFYLRGGDQQRTIKPIYLFLHIEGARFKLATGERIREDEWNARKQLVKNRSSQAKFINPKLIDLRTKVEDFVYENELDWKGVSTTFVKEKLMTSSDEDEVEESNKGLLFLYDSFLAQIKVEVNARKISKGYFQNLKAFRMHLQSFLQEKKYHLSIDIGEVDPEFAEDLKLYFVKLSFGANTIDKHFRSFKRFLKWAKTRSYVKDLDITHPGFKTKPERVDYPALSELELLRFKELGLAQNPRLERVRDQFVFLCEQGLRFSDLQNLTTKDVKTYKDELEEEISYIEYYTQKTKEHVIAPLSAIGEELIDTYYKSSNKKVFPTISNQKFNNYLKELAKLAEVEKDISSHTGRRTFITLSIERGKDLESIMIHTGHRSMDELLRYWKKSKAHRLKKGRL